jgi:hypothetical protein
LIIQFSSFFTCIGLLIYIIQSDSDLLRGILGKYAEIFLMLMIFPIYLLFTLKDLSKYSGFNLFGMIVAVLVIGMITIDSFIVIFTSGENKVDNFNVKDSPRIVGSILYTWDINVMLTEFYYFMLNQNHFLVALRL